MEKEGSIFCAAQKESYSTFKTLMRENPKFCEFVRTTESSNNCRGYQLEDMLVACFQRITKYPLLISELLSETKAKTRDFKNVEIALNRSREILTVINRAIKTKEMKIRMTELRALMEQTTVNMK